MGSSQSMRHACVESCGHEDCGYAQPLCVQREAVNKRALLSSPDVELGCFRVNTPKSGDNKSNHNGTTHVCIASLKFSV